MLCFSTLEEASTLSLDAGTDVLALGVVTIAYHWFLFVSLVLCPSSARRSRRQVQVSKHASDKELAASRQREEGHQSSFAASHCRWSRFMHCRKRAARRHRGKEGCCLSARGCPISRAIAKLHAMPPPLPFYRRRCRAPAVEETAEETHSSTCSDSTIQGACTRTTTPHQDNASALQATKSTTTTPTPTRSPSDKTKRGKQHRTPVIDLARMQHWSEILVRSPIKKREAKYKDADGLLALHWACSGGPPLAVVQELIQAYPGAARHADSEGSVPLHFAAHYGGSVSVVQALLEAYPGATRIKDNYGRSPLYHAVSKASGIDVLRTLAQVEPTMVLEPCVPPSSEMTKSHVLDPLVLARHQRTPIFLAWFMALKNRRQGRDRTWDKAELLLREAYQMNASPGTQEKHFRMLHATIAFDSYLPKEIFRFALELYSEQAREIDELSGRTPLSLAAQSTSERASEWVTALLAVFPRGARIADATGRIPLMIAIAHGKAWIEGVQELFHAYPQGLERRDPQSGLCPALLSATVSHEGQGDKTMPPPKRPASPKSTTAMRHFDQPSTFKNHISTSTDTQARHLSTIYELVRANPAVVTW